MIPQPAISMPSYPKDLTFPQNSSKGRSAHYPENTATGLDIVSFFSWLNVK
jgi:hypothetical protein